jgi:hypothetical protein
MSTAWLVNISGLFITTVGALLLFLYLWRSPRFADYWLTPEGKRAYAKHRRLVVLAVGLIALWLVIQYLGIIAT